MSLLPQFQQVLLVCWRLKLVIHAGDRVLLMRLYSSTHVAILSLLERLYSVYSRDCTPSTHAAVLRRPRHVDVVGRRRRDLAERRDVDGPAGPLRLHARLVRRNRVLKR